MGATLIVANVSRLTRSVAFLSRLLEAGVEVRFCDLPQIEGPTGRFMLQQMVAVAELEAGLIRRPDPQGPCGREGPGQSSRQTREPYQAGRRPRSGPCKAHHDRRCARSRPLARHCGDPEQPGPSSLRQIAAGLNQRGIQTARGGSWSAVQVKRVLERG